MYTLLTYYVSELPDVLLASPIFDFLGSAGLGTLLGSIFSGISQSNINEENLANQNRLWEDQKAFNHSERLSAQHYNTSERLAVQRFNSPENQLNLYKQAGINPNSAMPQFANSSPASISGASASPQMTNMVNPFDFATIVKDAVEADKIRQEARAQEIDNDNKQDIYDLTKEQQRQAIEVAKADVAYKDAQKNWTEQQRKQSEELLPLLVSEKQENINLLQKSLVKYDAEIALVKQQTNTEVQQTNLTAAQTGLVNEERKREIWYNALREQGLDPNTSMMDNVTRILMTDPEKGQQIVSTTLKTAYDSMDTVTESVPKLLKGQVKKTAKKYLPPRWYKAGSAVYQLGHYYWHNITD